MDGYSVIYDTVIDGVRVVKVQIGSFTADISYSTRMGDDVHVKIEQPDGFGPDLDYVGGQFLMTYNYTVIPENFQSRFETAYRETKEFCQDAAPVLEKLTNIIKSGGIL